jgi:hypothetical protein
VPTHTFGSKTSPVQLAQLDAALYEAAGRGLPYWPLVVNTQTSSPYVLVLADGDPNHVVRANFASDGQVTVPTNASVAFPLGTRIPIDQWGAGQVHVVGASGVEVRRALSAWTRTQYSRAWLEKQGTNEWLLYGDLEPVFDSPA